MSNGQVHLSIRDGIASIVFDRPEARNAMTWAMYEELASICERISKDPAVRVATFRGAGGEAFVAGTDIEQFRAFTGGDDGVAYEKKIDAQIEQIERLPMPTVAIVEGWAIGGGLAISAACDFRIATPQASFGVPIARTLGNCLSMANTARVLAAFGVSRAKRLLLLADTIGAEEAKECGFVTEIAEAAELDAKAEALCSRLAKNAPVTMRASKEAMRRIVTEGLPPGEDLIRACYGSKDFKAGVEAFMEKKRPVWSGS
ncbi:enoyl-CoA hydratase/isomerase family protein [Noviherbaspirillum massiliense]|uniref:enoyl-CoA hydratase/isomerase family protein n=1 Tax=Noviherbaspirillum massiliense TaxID=1465823 RepID=UPI0002F07A30|nr:enoyl-CoA hydratase/isomerase family protein [Noviherbaspirillum massiliense]